MKCRINATFCTFRAVHIPLCTANPLNHRVHSLPLAVHRAEGAEQRQAVPHIIRKGVRTMAVVADYIAGDGCRIIVHDDCYINKSKEETDEIIKRVSKIVINAAIRRQMQKDTTA